MKFRGIILYDIQLDGNLTGIYTNNHPDASGQICVEYAHLKGHYIPEYRTDGNHTFDCSYFDHADGITSARLEFKIENRVIHAKWFLLENNTLIFTGEGFQMNERQLAISYTNVILNQ